MQQQATAQEMEAQGIEVVGAIKIKDGLFLGDTTAAAVGNSLYQNSNSLGSWIRRDQLSDPHHKLCWKAAFFVTIFHLMYLCNRTNSLNNNNGE